MYSPYHLFSCLPDSFAIAFPPALLKRKTKLINDEWRGTVFNSSLLFFWSLYFWGQLYTALHLSWVQGFRRLGVGRWISPVMKGSRSWVWRKRDVWDRLWISTDRVWMTEMIALIGKADVQVERTVIEKMRWFETVYRMQLSFQIRTL